MSDTKVARQRLPRGLRPLNIAMGIALVGALLLLIWIAASAGIASILTASAITSTSLADADRAIRFGPRDPNAHFVRANLLEAHNDLPSAIIEYQKAVALRPDDYVLWLSLSRAFELNGQNDDAIESGRKAVALAPYYADPRWMLGNLLIRHGKQDEGWSELARAGESNPALLPAIINLAWRLSKEDAQFVIRVVKPQRPESYLALAQYFQKHDKIDAATSMYEAAGSSADQARQGYIAELIQKKHFQEAYVLWSNKPPASQAVGMIIDVGFEQENNLDGVGFGWRSASKQGVKLSLDPEQPHGGQASLRIDFEGNSDPGTPVISQLVLIEPNTRYQLRLAARAEEIVSGGLPVLDVIDGNSGEVLGKATEISQAGAWREFTIDFTTSAATTAIQFSLKRNPCSSAPCPIYGRLWLDDFSLLKTQ
jgi:Tfp pilus assembly protein PilF